ncbi:hypothetical protein D3C85_1180970 [compost metagenome]
MPKARISTLSSPTASRSSLSHWMMVRSAMAAFSTGTRLSSGCSEITKPPGCWDRCRGKPISCRVRLNTRHSTGLSGSKPPSRRRSRGGASSLQWPQQSARALTWSGGKPRALATSRMAPAPW